MSSPPQNFRSHSRSHSHTGAGTSKDKATQGDDHTSYTHATFSPSTSSHSPSVTGKQRATILVQQKSALLVATPPQITRALAYSHPFIVPLNRLVGLISWTTGDPWESFLLVAGFWALCLYGDYITRLAAPLVVVTGLIFVMYARRYSQLSSTGWTGEKRPGHKRGISEAGTSQHKSLEDIVETLRLFTSRCNILLDPFLKMTDFLSTQVSATAATTRPALTSLFIRIILITPIWWIFTLPPLHIITTKRVIMAIGTTILTWHSQPARVTRTLFWRSKTFRRLCTVLTGLELADPAEWVPPSEIAEVTSKRKTPHEIAAKLAAKGGRDASIRLTFTLYENQRRWLGIGWTSSMLAYERGPWTDDHLNNTASSDNFELPDVEGGHAKWKWASGSSWHVVNTEGEIEEDPDGANSEGGWIYYDNKWQNGRKGKDGWGRYTRRRRWCRDAELIEISPPTTPPPLPTRRGDDAASTTTTLVDRVADDTQSMDSAITSGTVRDENDPSAGSARRKKAWFSRRTSQPTSEKSVAMSTSSIRSNRDEEDDVHVPLNQKEADVQSTWGVGDDAQMNLS